MQAPVQALVPALNYPAELLLQAHEQAQGASKGGAAEQKKQHIFIMKYSVILKLTT